MTLGIWPVPSMPPGSVCKVVGLRKYSQVSLCSRAGLSLVPRDPQDTPTEIYLLGTQADAGPSRESQMLGGVTSIQEKIRPFGAVEVLGGLPRAEVATWHCLTQSGRAPHVGTRRQRSRKTLMTTTQGCRPLARAFGERNALLALSHMHVAERVCVCEAEGTRADPGDGELGQGSCPGSGGHGEMLGAWLSGLEGGG